MIKSLFRRSYDSIKEDIVTVFPEKDRVYATEFFLKYISPSKGYLEIDFYRNSIETKQNFFERAAFFFLNKPRGRGEYYDLCLGSYSEDRVCMVKNTGKIVLVKNDNELPTIELADNFSNFVKIVSENDSGFANKLSESGAIHHLMNRTQHETTKIEEIRAFFDAQNEEEPSEFDFLLPDNYRCHTKCSFFYRAQFCIEFPGKQLKETLLPNGDWWEIGYGLGDEDVGQMEGKIIIDRISGNLAYFAPSTPLDNHPGLIKRFWNYFFPPSTRNEQYEENEFFVFSPDIVHFISALQQYKAVIG